MSNKNPKLRKNGGEGTAVGNFLRGINFSKVTDVVTSVLSGDIKGAIQTISNSKELSAEQMQLALKELEMDTIEMSEMTKRLETDNEHTITRLVRPVTYGLMFVLFISIVILDGNLGEFSINKSYIPVIESLFTTMTVFYFGSRGLEKMVKTFKK